MLRHFHLHLRLFNNLQHMLVGGIPTRQKNMKVSWDDEIPNIWETKFMFHVGVFWWCLLEITWGPALQARMHQLCLT